MDLSPSMRLYVADAAADVVRIFDVSVPDAAADLHAVARTRVEPSRPGVLGGSGTDPGLFLEPYSVDASSALFVTVADAGNGRIQRFTKDGALVEVLPVPRGSSDAQGVDPRFRAEDPAVGASATSARPIAVETTPADDVLVVEAETASVLMADGRNRAWSTLGSAQRRPVDPVDVEFIGSRIHVADAGGGRLYAFDRLGSLLGVASLPADGVTGASDITALVPASGAPAVLAGNDLAWPATDGAAAGRSVLIRFLTDEVVRDARRAGNVLLVLTNRSLFVVPAAGGVP